MGSLIGQRPPSLPSLLFKKAMVFRGQDKWRKHPIFKWTWMDMLPGLKEGAAAFAVFVAAETVYDMMNKKSAAPQAHAHAAEGSTGHSAAH